MRKLFLLFWALLATTCLWAHDFVVDGIYYNFLDDNNVAVTYKGSSYDAYNNEYSGEVTIPETVSYNGTTYSITSIGRSAFSGCSSLTSVTIPNSVTSIENGAFRGCSSLTSIIIPNSVTSIGEWAFQNCSSLTSITIPNSVTSIERGAFYGCSSLTSFTIPNSVSSIGDYAFQGCSSLASVTIPNSVTNIGTYAFDGCSSLTSIKTEATTPPSLGSYVFPTNLKIIYIPDNTLSAYQQAWGYEYPFINNENSLTLHVETPSTLSDLIFAAGMRPVDIAKLTLTGTLNGDDFTCMRETMTSLIDVDLSGITNTNGVNFDDKSKLLKIILPNNLTSIESYAFSSCSSLTSITIPNSVTSIGEWAFRGCSSLTSITIPNSITSIGDCAFYDCSSLTSITIPNSVTSIGDGVFLRCSSLTSITIPNSVTSIERGAFSWCYALSLVTLTAPSVEAFCNGQGNNLLRNAECHALRKIAINGEIITSITIPNSITSIGDGTFYACSDLTSITIPNSVTSIGMRAFSGCSSLTSITIPNSVTSIGDYAFDGCSSLTSIIIPNSVTSIREGVFSRCSSLTSIVIPNSVTSIGYGAFSGCSSLTSITIPNSVMSIGDWAFEYCSSLKTVICEAVEVPELGVRVFRYMPLSEATLYVPAQSLDDYKAADQWKEFGTILSIEEDNPDVDIELQNTEMTIVFTNTEDNNNEIHSQTITIQVPAAPEIAGFTFLYWQPVAVPITNVITIQAIYEADVQSSAPEVFVNPSNPAQKLLRNGQVYILQDGQTYTIQGQQL